MYSVVLGESKDGLWVSTRSREVNLSWVVVVIEWGHRPFRLA